MGGERGREKMGGERGRGVECCVSHSKLLESTNLCM